MTDKSKLRQIRENIPKVYDSGWTYGYDTGRAEGFSQGYVQGYDNGTAAATPKGEVELTENNKTYDVTKYASAKVNIAGLEDLSPALTEQEELVAELKSIIAQKAKLGDAKLPSLIDGTVTELTAEDLAGCTKIRDNAFHSMSSLVSAELPESVLTIGKQSFYLCSSLTNIKLNARLTQMLDNAFYSCKLTSIVFPKTLTKIGAGAFYFCRLQYVDLTAYGTDSTFPTLDNKSAFANNTPSTFEIRVPQGRKAELAAMTNWSTYADNIVEV